MTQISMMAKETIQFADSGAVDVISHTGVEFRCNAEFMRNYIKYIVK